MRSYPLLAFLVLGGGCSLPGGEAPALGEQAQAFRECPPDTCGSNSPKVDAHGFHELHVKGKPNEQGMSLIGAQLGHTAMQLEVHGGQLLARGGGRTLRGAALVGLRVALEVPGSDGVLSYELELMRYRDLPYPVPGNAKDSTGAYVFEYTDGNGQRQNLCTGSGGSTDLPYEETFGQLAAEALLYEGDRINPETMTIDRSVDPLWFNIGCAGHTLAKLHLTRNSTASGAARYGHSLDDRQATLKMLVADYCGTGHPFTVAGQPLVWRDDQGVMNFFSAPISLEARWNANGAECLDEPRMFYPGTIEGKLKFPDILTSIGAECPQLLSKRCRDTDPYSFDGQARVSGNRVR